MSEKRSCPALQFYRKSTQFHCRFSEQVQSAFSAIAATLEANRERTETLWTEESLRLTRAYGRPSPLKIFCEIVFLSHNIISPDLPLGNYFFTLY